MNRRFYRLKSDDAFPSNYSLRLERQYNLPGIACDCCGSTWGSIGHVYPAFDLPAGLNRKHYESRWPVPVEKFVKLSQPLRDAWEKDLPVEPGLEFGKCLGSARGQFGDFAWRSDWVPFMSIAAFNALVELGFPIIGRQGDIHWNKGRFEYLELHIENFVELEERTGTGSLRQNALVAGDSTTANSISITWTCSAPQ